VSLFEVAYLLPGGPSVVRLSLPIGENDAAHKALEVANDTQCDTVVCRAGTDDVVQTIRYRPNPLPPKPPLGEPWTPPPRS
jgi:hypothetical protein